MILHPSESTLSRYSDGGLTGMLTRRVAAHLESCAECRAVVASVRELGGSARAAEAPAMRGGVWENIAGRRGGGERVILPVESVRAAARSARWIGVAAAVIVAAILALPIVRGASASELGKLSFAPALPRPGATITVRYRPLAALAEQSQLLLRAKYVATGPFGYFDVHAWRPKGPVVATLTRQADGRFTATLRLPDSAVYALWSVSDRSGEIVDSDHGRLWELETAAPNGRPAFSSLLARVAAAYPGRTSDRANAAADSLVAIYPDSAQSWATQVSVQGSSRIPHWLNVFGKRESRFARLEQSVGARDSVSAAELEAMVSFAAAIEDSAAEQRWRVKLVEAHPFTPQTISVVYWRVINEPRDSAKALLRTIDSVNISSAGVHTLIVDMGLDVAARTGDTAAVKRWVMEALATSEPGYRPWWPAEAREDPVVRAAMVKTLRAQIAELLNDSAVAQPLLSTRSRDRMYRRGLAAGAMGMLSQALVRDKAYAAASDTLNVAIAMTNGDCGFAYLHRYRAGIELTLGDTAAAERDLAIGVAPTGSPTGAFGDSAAIVLGRAYQAARWNALLDSATARERLCSKKWATP